MIKKWYQGLSFLIVLLLMALPVLQTNAEQDHSSQPVQSELLSSETSLDHQGDSPMHVEKEECDEPGGAIDRCPLCFCIHAAIFYKDFAVQDVPKPAVLANQGRHTLYHIFLFPSLRPPIA